MFTYQNPFFNCLLLGKPVCGAPGRPCGLIHLGLDDATGCYHRWLTKSEQCLSRPGSSSCDRYRSIDIQIPQVMTFTSSAADLAQDVQDESTRVDQRRRLSVQRRKRKSERIYFGVPDMCHLLSRPKLNDYAPLQTNMDRENGPCKPMFPLPPSGLQGPGSSAGIPSHLAPVHQTARPPGSSSGGSARTADFGALVSINLKGTSKPRLRLLHGVGLHQTHGPTAWSPQRSWSPLKKALEVNIREIQGVKL